MKFLFIIWLLASGLFVVGCGNSSKSVKPRSQPPRTQLPLIAYIPQPAEEPVFKLGHAEEFGNLQYLQDGKFLVALTSDRLELFDTQALERVHTLKASSEPYTAMAVDHRGNLVAVAQGSQIILWNPESGEQIQTLQADKKVLALSFSPDGQLLASGGYDAIVTLWDPGKAGRIGTLKGHAGWVHALSFHPSGKLLASGSDDGKIMLWDVEMKRSLGVLEQYRSEIRKVVFSHGGQVLASVDKNGAVVLWDPTGQRRFLTLTTSTLRQAQGLALTTIPIDPENTLTTEQENNPSSRSSQVGQPYTRILSAAFSPDDRILVLGSTDKNLTLWSIPQGKVVKTLGSGPSTSANRDLPQTVVYSPDGRTLGVGGSAVTLWDIENGSILHSTQQYAGAIQSLSFSPNGKVLAAGGSDRKITLWSLTDKNPVVVLEGNEMPTTSLAFSSEGKYLASAGSGPGRPITLWDLENGKPFKSFTGPSQKINHLAFRPDGQQLVLASDNVFLWDIQRGDTVSVITRSSFEDAPLAFSPDGRLLALAAGDGQIIVWDTQTKKVVKTLSGHKDRIQVLLFSPDGQALVSSDNLEVVLWNVQSGNAIVTFEEPVLQAKFLVFSLDGKFLVFPTGPQRNLIAFRSIESGQVVRTLQGHDTAITNLLFASSGLLASTSYNKVILWNGATGQLLKTFEASRPFDFLSFSPDGKILAAGGYDKIILWDVDRGNVIASLEESGFSDSITFSPDGRFLAAILPDEVTLWDGRRGNPLKTLEKPNLPISSLAFSSDSQVLVAVGDLEYKTFASWDMGSGKMLSVLNGIEQKTTSIAFDPVHQILATGSEDGLSLLWDIKTMKVKKALAGPSGDIISLSFSRDNKVLASQSFNSALFWDMEGGGIRRILQTFPLYAFFFNPAYSSTRVELMDIGETQRITFSPDLKILAIINRGNAVTLLDAQSGQAIKNLERESYSSLSPSSLIFSPDGRFLALKDEVGKVTLWNVESGRALHTLFSAGRILFSPDGEVLVSEGADENHTITLWDVPSGQILKTLSQSGYDTISLAFSPDGNLLALGGGDGTISVYNVQ